MALAGDNSSSVRSRSLSRVMAIPHSSAAPGTARRGRLGLGLQQARGHSDLDRSRLTRIELRGQRPCRRRVRWLGRHRPSDGTTALIGGGTGRHRWSGRRGVCLHRLRGIVERSRPSWSRNGWAMRCLRERRRTLRRREDRADRRQRESISCHRLGVICSPSSGHLDPTADAHRRPERLGFGFFGTSVALAVDGQTAMVGAPADNSGIGAVFAFAPPDPVCSSVSATTPQGGGVGSGVALVHAALRAHRPNYAILGGPSNGHVSAVQRGNRPTHLHARRRASRARTRSPTA